MHLPLSVQTAYHDLLQRHQHEPVVDVSGSPRTKTISGKTHWISTQRIGKGLKDTYLGPDTPETRERVEVIRNQQDVHKAWARETSALVAALKSAGSLAPDVTTSRVLQAVARTGFFDAGGLIGGTNAFRFYPLALGIRPPEVSNLMTGDVDLVAPNGLRLNAPRSLSALMGDLGVKGEPVFHLTERRPMKYLFEGSVEMEVLSSVKTGGQTSHYHDGISEQVQALRFLEFSMKAPVEAVCLYRSGFRVRVPAPQRYALHKLLVSERRTGTFRDKSRKDLKQAEWLIAALAEDRPYELWEAWEDLWGRGRTWRTLAVRALGKIPSAKAGLCAVLAEYGDVPDLLGM